MRQKHQIQNSTKNKLGFKTQNFPSFWFTTGKVWYKSFKNCWDMRLPIFFQQCFSWFVVWFPLFGFFFQVMKTLPGFFIIMEEKDWELHPRREKRLFSFGKSPPIFLSPSTNGSMHLPGFSLAPSAAPLCWCVVNTYRSCRGTGWRCWPSLPSAWSSSKSASGTWH